MKKKMRKNTRRKIPMDNVEKKAGKMPAPMRGNKVQKYFCVWSDEATIICLTTDYGMALDVYGNYMVDSGYLTDDEWAEASAYIETFDEFPSDNPIIMDYLSDNEKLKWKHGETVLF
jgi:hypothetical protein